MISNFDCPWHPQIGEEVAFAAKYLSGCNVGDNYY